LKWLSLMIAFPALAGAAVSEVPAGVSSLSRPVLIASVGPGSTMTLQTSAGKPVRKLRAGRYTIVVRDRSGARDFKLSDANPNTRDWETDLSFVGTIRWNVPLRFGTYRYLSVGRPILRGTFQVT
jgi:hypothetical protein